MLFIISLSIALTAAFLLGKPLKKRPAVFYVTAAVLTVSSIIIKQSDIAVNGFFTDYVLAVFTRGALGAAFWAVVMWAGALPNGSAPIKKLMPIRGELSIIAATLTFSHVVTYGVQYITDIVRDRTGSGDAFRDFVITSIVCLIMVLIMTPLTIMSFKAVRKKMPPKTWKKIQRTAYIFYALIYVHIMVLFVPKAQNGRDGYFLSVIVYSAVFIGYAVMRIRKAYLAKRKPELRRVLNAVCACAMIVPICLIAIISRNTSHNETITATKEAPATFTFEAPVTDAATTETLTSSAASTTSAATTVTTTASVTVTSELTSSVTTETVSETVSTSAEITEETVPETAEPVTSSVLSDEYVPSVTSETAAVQQSTAVTSETVTETKAAIETEAAETKPTYRYKNGTFGGLGDGYSGTVHVSITIENDYITAFSAYADNDDPDYFSDAMQYVIPQIQRSLTADVDACSGATYSSKGIIEAAKNALEKAKN